MQWYYAKDNAQFGPVSNSEMIAMLEIGEILATDRVWRDGMKDWVTVAAVEELTMTYPSVPFPISRNEVDISPYAPPMAPGGVTMPKPTSGLAVASMVMGIMGLLTCFFLSIGGVICGHLALSEMARPGTNMSGRGMAITGLITGYIAIGLTAVMIMVGFFAMVFG